MEKLVSLSRKGQVGNLAPAILSLVFAAIVLVFGIIISQALTNTTTGSENHITANESVSAFSGTETKTLIAPTTCGFGTVDNSTVEVYNKTGGIIQSGNYTVLPAGTITNLSVLNASINYGWLISYDYTSGGESCIASNKTVVGLGTFADFWEIIVLAIVITVVIGLLLVVFGGTSKGR